MPTPETRVNNDIKDYVEQLEKLGAPIALHRRDATSPNYKKGLPDFYIEVGPFHIEMECKAPGETLRVDQKRFKRKCETLYKGIHWTIDNVEDFKVNIHYILSLVDDVNSLIEDAPWQK